MSNSGFILFDLDNTLYLRSCGLFDHIDNLINRYLKEVVKIPAYEVDAKRRSYMLEHGTTLNGLMVHHQVDPYDYLDFVHDVPLRDYLQPDKKIKNMLTELPEKKYIFSNASKEHCRRVLDCLELQNSFSAVYDITYFNFRPKPEKAIYRELLDKIGVPAGAGVMIDDMAVNLEPAVDLGMAAILFDPLGTTDLPTGGRRLTSLLELPSMLDKIRNEKKSE